MTNKTIKPGDIYLAKKFGDSEFKKGRPVVICHEKGNRVKVIPMSSKTKNIHPWQLYAGKVFGDQESKIMCKQTKSISKKSLIKKMGELSPELFDKAKILVKKCGK